MCGVIGIYLDPVCDENVKLVERLFRQSMIRGKHATGVTYFKNGQLNTIKEPVPVTEFFNHHKVTDWIDNDKLVLIGHTRYSTSDLRYNQPIEDKDQAIAHNGVISQDPDNWEFETETLNDSELILRCLQAEETHPLSYYKDRSMAVTQLSLLNGFPNLFGYRNHERPLWYTVLRNGIIFTSTKDIAIRSGLVSPKKCEMFTEYQYDPKELNFVRETQYAFPAIKDLQ